MTRVDSMEMKETINVPAAGGSPNMRPSSDNEDSTVVSSPVSEEVEVPPFPDPYDGENPLEILPAKQILTEAPSLLWWYLQKSFHHYRYNMKSLKKETLSGLTVSILQVPESVAFSYVAGVDPISGLHATFFLGLITAAVGGKPGMISGAAGALAVVMKDLMADDGPLEDLNKAERFEHLLMCVVFIGVFQMVASFLLLAKFVRLIPQSAMIGFMNGLAIIIFMAQFTAFQECNKYEEFQQCTEDERTYMSLKKGETWILLVHVFLTMFIMHFFPKVPKIGKMLPASMVALVIGTAFEHGINRSLIGYDTRTVGDTAPIDGDFPKGHLPDVSGTDHWGVILSYAGSLAAIGLIESVMTLQAVDEITETPPSTLRSNQECFAQGLANLFCGFFGAMGGDAMIGQSTINVINGARGRLSGMIAGIAMLLIVVVASPVIEYVPIGSLTGVLFMVVIHTFNWGTFKLLTKVRKSDAFVIILVTVLAVVTNLAIAVFAGVVFVALVNSWDAGKILKATTATFTDKHGTETKIYRLYGSLFFGSSRTFTTLFNPKNDPEHVIINFENSLICDYSAIAALYALQQRYANYGKRVTIEKLSTKSKNQLRKQGHIAEAVNYNLNSPSFIAMTDPEIPTFSPLAGPVASPTSPSGSKKKAVHKSGSQPTDVSQLSMFQLPPAGPKDEEELFEEIEKVDHDPTLHDLTTEVEGEDEKEKEKELPKLVVDSDEEEN